MSDQNIELSKEGIKISYLRFLSDSAAGLLVILIAVAAYYLPLFGSPFRVVNNQVLSTEAKILVVVLLILLSSPVGLTINAMSWFTLSWLQVGLQHFWFKERRLFGKGRVLFKHFRQEFQTDLTTNYFALSDDNWYVRSQLVKQTMHIYQPCIINTLEHVKGIRALFRSLAFLALVFFLMSIILRWEHLNARMFFIIAGWSIPLFIITILVSSALGFFYTSQIFYRAYILCLATESKTEVKQDFNKWMVSVLSGSDSKATDTTHAV